jgi:hypothetical protein
MNNCRDIEKLLAAFRDGKLATQDRARVEAHLQACPDCAREMASLADGEKVVAGLARVRATGDFLERVHARLERPRPAARWKRIFSGPSWIKIPLEVAAAAAAVLLIYAVAREEPALYRPPAAPSAKMVFRQEEKAKAADAFALKSVGETREAATAMRYAAAPPVRLRLSVPDQAPVVRAAVPSLGLEEKTEAPAASGLVVAKRMAEPGTKPDVSGQIAGIARRMGGERIAPAVGGGSESPASVDVEIPLSRYNDFLQELGRIGELDKASPPPPPSDQETLRLRIEIL